MDEQPTIRVAVGPPAGADERGVLHMTGPLTPYEAESIAEGAVGGGRLDIVLPAGTSQVVLARIAARFLALRRHGLEVRVGCEGHAEGSVALPPTVPVHPGRAAG